MMTVQALGPDNLVPRRTWVWTRCAGCRTMPPKGCHPPATNHTHSLSPSPPYRGSRGTPPAEIGQGGTPAPGEAAPTPLLRRASAAVVPPPSPMS